MISCQKTGFGPVAGYLNIVKPIDFGKILYRRVGIVEHYDLRSYKKKLQVGFFFIKMGFYSEPDYSKSGRILNMKHVATIEKDVLMNH